MQYNYIMELKELVKENRRASFVKPSSVEFLIPETRKLIKKGQYKKAFQMLDQCFAGPKKLSLVHKVRLCRRIMATLVALTAKYVNKYDNRKQNHILRLLDAGTNYLTHWHNSISKFVVKTNKKFQYLQNLLEDISSLSDDDSATQPPNDSRSRRSSRRDSTKANTAVLGTMSKTPNKNERQSQLLIQILKSQDGRNGNYENILDNSSNEGDGSNFVGEELTATFNLDEFIGYLVLHLLNYAIYYKKVQMYSLCYKCFAFCYRATKHLESSLNPALLNICAKARIPFGVFYLEFGRYKEAQEIFDSVTKMLQLELSVRFNNANRDSNDDTELMKRIRKATRMLCMTLLNMAKNYELQFQYSKLMECYKIANWFTKKLLNNEDDEFSLGILRAYNKAKEEYGAHLEEVGEMERIVFENKDDENINQDKSSKTQQDHFGELQEQLYSKFNNANLNKRRIAVKIDASPVFLKKGVKGEFSNSKSDFEFGFLEKITGDTGSPFQRFVSELNPNKLPHEGEKEATGSDAAYHEKSKRSRKDKKAIKKLALHLDHESKKLIDTARYTEHDFEKEVNDMQVSEDEEKRWIKQLNSSIRIQGPKSTTSQGSLHSTATTSSTAAGTLGFVDVDGFFASRIEQYIGATEDEKSKPQDFGRIVKNHIYFKKNEEFDHKNFKFGRGMLHFKRHENLGEDKLDIKNMMIGGFRKEKREVQTNGFFTSTQTQVENIIQTRFNVSKVLSTRHSPWDSKKAFTRVGSLILVKKELPPVDVGKDEGEGKSSAAVSRNIYQRARSEGILKTKELFESNGSNPDEIETKPDPEHWKQINVSVKERVTHMLEDLASEIKDDNYFTKRIESNQPIFQEKKKKEKFLKGLDELSNSCRLFSIKSEATKKSMDFTNIVRLQLKSSSGEKKKDKLRRRTVVLISQKEQSND